MRAQAAKRNEITVDLILRELDEARRSLESGQISAAVAASLGRAKVAGLITDRVERVYTSRAGRHRGSRSQRGEWLALSQA